MIDTEKQIQRAIDIYKSTVLTKNVDAFMQLYDPDVRVFDTWGVWSYAGVDAWRVAIEGWFSSLQGDTCRVTFDKVEIIQGDGFAAMTAFVGYAGMAASGEELRSMQNRMSWVLKTSGHVMRIVHEHTSAPIGFEDAKAILKR